MAFSCGCDPKGLLEPTFKTSKHFTDLSASFAVNTKHEQLSTHYSWLVELRKEFSQTAKPYVEATLQNPEGGPPLQVPAIELVDTQKSFDKRRYYIVSPALPRLGCGLYEVKLTAYTDKNKSKKLAEHSNHILSRINTETCYKQEFLDKMQALASNGQSWTDARPTSSS
ncbi:hypothetical protein BZG36_02859 [Bifiguratus adelaidae]|uniref:Uncharacterized protein n=1 Tax=Bifiguratus adelaidae TaxID=1938954 RepID=A0A261Y0I5_9FUNG|nr:hypothetical protein BZG36_02859 [Bifiguratus adelaidae]